MSFVRIKDKDTGHEFSVPEERMEAMSGVYAALDKPAEDSGGRPLPPKYKTTVATKAAAKKAETSGRQDSSDKENN